MKSKPNKQPTIEMLNNYGETVLSNLITFNLTFEKKNTIVTVISWKHVNFSISFEPKM